MRRQNNLYDNTKDLRYVHHQLCHLLPLLHTCVCISHWPKDLCGVLRQNLRYTEHWSQEHPVFTSKVFPDIITLVPFLVSRTGWSLLTFIFGSNTQFLSPVIIFQKDRVLPSYLLRDVRRYFFPSFSVWCWDFLVSSFLNIYCVQI